VTRMNEESLVQETTAEYMHHVLGWESVNAISETYGKDGLLGRVSPKQVVLVRYLRAKLEELNPGLPSSAYEEIKSIFVCKFPSIREIN